MFSYLIPIIFGSTYKDSITVTILVSVAFGFGGIYRIPVLVISFYKKNNLIALLTVIAAISNLIISLYFIDSLGFLSPATGTIIAYFILSISCYYYAYKQIKCVRLNE